MIADGSAAGRDEHVRLDAVQLPRDLVDAIAGDAEQDRLGSRLARKLPERVRVRLHQLARRRLLPEHDQLVSGGEHGDARLTMHLHASCLACRRE